MIVLLQKSYPKEKEEKLRSLLSDMTALLNLNPSATPSIAQDGGVNNGGGNPNHDPKGRFAALPAHLKIETDRENLPSNQNNFSSYQDRKTGEYIVVHGHRKHPLENQSATSPVSEAPASENEKSAEKSLFSHFLEKNNQANEWVYQHLSAQMSTVLRTLEPIVGAPTELPFWFLPSAQGLRLLEKGGKIALAGGLKEEKAFNSLLERKEAHFPKKEQPSSPSKTSKEPKRSEEKPPEKSSFPYGPREMSLEELKAGEQNGSGAHLLKEHTLRLEGKENIREQELAERARKTGHPASAFYSEHSALDALNKALQSHENRFKIQNWLLSPSNTKNLTIHITLKNFVGKTVKAGTSKALSVRGAAFILKKTGNPKNPFIIYTGHPR